MSSQPSFLRFTDWKNEFELEEFNQFLSEFDIDDPDFLAWIEHNQAPYAYFQFYSLLVKNYHQQQQDISKILTFLLLQKPDHRSAFISYIKEPQKKYPDILDLEKFEEVLLQHLKYKDIPSYFLEFESLFNACCLFYFSFPKIPTYLCQYVTVESTKLIQQLIQCSYWHNQDYGILDKLLEFTKKGYRYNIYHDLKNWAERSENLNIREKIATIMQLILSDLLKEPTPYFTETYLHALQNHQANTIEGYIDFLRYLPNTKTKELLNQIIENQNLHIAIRFESILVYFLTFQQQHSLKQELTHNLLTLPLNQRWGGCSSNNGFVHSYDLFKQNDFFSLDEALLALQSTQWCYEACKPLHNYSKDIEIQQKIISTVVDAIAAMIQRMLKVDTNDYVNAAPIGYLADVLKSYDLNSLQRQQLEHTLLDGLEQCIDHFSEQKHLHKELTEIIDSLGFNVPDSYFDLLGRWEKCALKWKKQGLTPEQIFQMLIDAEAIPANKVFNPDYPVLPNALFPDNEAENFLMYNPRGDKPFYIELFNNFFPYKVKWFWNDADIANIPSDQIIHFNQVNPQLEWQSIKDFYFQYNEKYYHFFIYDFMDRDWVNQPSIMAVFHQILQHFNITNKVIYSLGDNEGRDGNEIYFAAHPEKFDELNKILQTPCENIAKFFIPEAQTPEFLNIEAQYRQVIANQGFISDLNQTFIRIPEIQSQTSRQSKEWLIHMIDEMRHQALNYLGRDDFTQKAIDIRNLFISLALNMVGDYCVANNLKKQFPLWNNTRYQNESLNVKQRMDLLETIFNAEDLATHLKYPYD